MLRRSARQTVEISLFPFLAVLICTMGALIVLFVVMVLQARNAAVAVEIPRLEIAAPVEPAPSQSAPEPVEDLSEQFAQLEQLRAKLLEQLEQSRLQLSGLEDHEHRLVERLKQLKAEIAILEGEITNVTGSAEDAETQLAKLETELVDAQTELDQVKQQVSQRKPAYALIPYDGRSGTRRQPIYIECTAEAVVIQPEGITLIGADFLPPLGPGNALAASLRTIREYRQSQGVPGQDNPYPLLIVRPGGAESYAAAREALKSWDDEFGYELVDADTELAYPPTDRFLARRLMQTVEIARQRKMELILAAPRRYGRIEDQYLIASRNAGFQSEWQGSAGDGFMDNRFVNSSGANSRSGVPGDGSPSSTPGGAPESFSRPGRQAGSPDQTDPTSEQLQLNSAQGDPQPPQSYRTSSDPRPEEAAMSRYGESRPRSAANGDGTGTREALNPLAAQRGANWAVPGAAPRGTGITRPIQLACGRSTLTLAADAGGAPPQTISTTLGTTAAVDQLTKSIGQRITRWGMAGRNFYWKPVLEVRVEPGGEETFQQLQTLLYGSGIEVTRK